MTDNATLAEMGRRLRDAAQDAGITLRELGDRMGVSRPTVYAYASGALRMSPDRIRQAAEITGKPEGFFDPRNLDHLDSRSSMAQTFRLIDALLCPASPAKASEAAVEALEKHPEAETPGIRAELLVKAGRAMTLSGDYVPAVRHLEAAKVLLTEDNGEKLASCCQTLGFCYTNLGRLVEAKACFDTALSLYEPDSKWRSQVALAALAERSGEFAEAESRLSGLLDDPALPDSALAYVRANYASIVCTTGRWSSGLAQAETALEAAFATGSKDQVAEMLILAGMALTALGRIEEATLMVVRARDVCFTLQDEARSTLVKVTTAQLLKSLQDSDRARTIAHEAYTKALECQYRRSESAALLLLAELALDRKDYLGARELSAQVRSHGAAHSYVVASAVGGAFEAIASARLGHPQQAEESLASAVASVVRIGKGRPAILTLEAKGEVLLAQNHVPAAHEAFVEAFEEADNALLVPDALRLAQRLSELGASAELSTKTTRFLYDSAELGTIMEPNLSSEVLRRLLVGLPVSGPAKASDPKELK